MSKKKTYFVKYANNQAKNEDRINAACKVLQIIKDSKQPISALMINAIVDLIRNAKTTKLDLDAAIAKFQSINKP